MDREPATEHTASGRPAEREWTQEIPAQPTPLIGRDQELEQACAHLLRSNVRLLTLVGPAGVGKTRLAFELVARTGELFAHGAFFVDLTPIGDPALVVPAIMRALGVHETRGLEVSEQLRRTLHDKHLLLVLDNCEQVLGAALEVAELLAACPGLKILATSRAPLRLRWEHALPVPPLALPDLRHLPTPQALADVPAVALFIERAQAVGGGFRLTGEDARAVAEICVRLDGLPLAIELAAARSDILSAQAILARLARTTDVSPLEVLAAGARDLPPRHRTLRAALDWSYHLLAADEQALFRRLAVFVGSFTLEAAAAVCEMPPDPQSPMAAGSESDPHPTEGAVPQRGRRVLRAAKHDKAAVKNVPSPNLDRLTALVRNSLLRQEAGPEGEPCFRMLETIREYALERLADSGETVEVRQRHVEYYLALAEQAATALLGPRQAVWLERLEREHDNLRAALRWAEERAGAETALRLGGALWRLWWLHGYLSEGQRWLEGALSLPGSAPTPVRAKALNAVGVLAHVQGDYERAARRLGEGLAFWRADGDKHGIAAALHNLGALARERGDQEQAARLFEESLALERELGDTWGIATSLDNLGALARDGGHLERAAALHEESLALRRQLGDERGVATSLSHMGEVARDRGDWQRAVALHVESLALWCELGDRWGIATSLHDLGRAVHLQGDHARAATWLSDGLALFREMGAKQGTAACLEGLGAVACARRQARRAARLLGAAEALREAIGSPLPPTERETYLRTVEASRSMLDEAAFSATWLEGRAAPQRVVEEVLAEASRVSGSWSRVERQDARPETRDARLGLTPREQQVADLVARGLSNRQIGEALVITEQTVETHVKHILSKLGFGSRAQIAGWVVERELRG